MHARRRHQRRQVRAAGTIEQVSAGEDLEERFLQLVGGRHAAAKLSWLDGGYAANGVAPADSSAPTAPFPSPEES